MSAGRRNTPQRDRKQRFIDEYPVDTNGTQAAIRAGFSKSSARTIAARMLADDNIRSKIDAKLAEMRKPALKAAALQALSKAELVDQLVPLVRTHMGHIAPKMHELLEVSEDGKTWHIREEALTQQQWAAVKKLKFDDNMRPVIELYDRRQAAFDLAQILGYVVQKLNVRKVQSMDDLDDEELAKLAASAPADLDTGDQRAN